MEKELKPLSRQSLTDIMHLLLRSEIATSITFIPNDVCHVAVGLAENPEGETVWRGQYDTDSDFPTAEVKQWVVKTAYEMYPLADIWKRWGPR